MYRVGVIGDRDSVIGFKALGMTVMEADNAEQASRHLAKMVNENYAVVYITEKCAEDNYEMLKELRSRRLPAIIPIPSIAGSTGLGMRQVRESVRKAVGIDLFDSTEEETSEQV